MRKGIALALVALFAVALVASQRHVPSPDEVVTRKYSGPDGITLEGLGVCSIGEQAIRCWDMDGQPSESLAKSIQSFYESNSGMDVQLKFGKRNRFLVLKKSHFNGSSSVQPADGSYAQNITIGGGTEGSLELVRYTNDEAATASLLVSLHGLPGPKPVDIPFVKGESARFEGITLEVGPVEPAKLPTQGGPGFYPGYGPYNLNPKQKWWSVFMGRTSEDQGPSQLNFGLFGKDRKPIRYVDVNGEPISDVEYLRSLPPSGLQWEPGRIPKYTPASFQATSEATPGAAKYLTNVNPSRIGFLRVAGWREKKIQINGFPLEPKTP